MKEKILKFIKSGKAFYLLIFITMLILFYFMPYQGDDWSWGSDAGWNLFKNLFKDYNGRYLGNILIIIMSRSAILRSLITTGTLFLIVYLIKKTFNIKRDMDIYLIIILLFSMDSMIMSQAVIWTSGFANYVPPALIFLSVLYINKEAFSNEKYTIKHNKIFLLFLLGIVGSLFAEHMTIYFLLLSVFILIFNRIKQKKYTVAHISYLIGTISGTILMFSNGAYYRVLNNADEYRDIVHYSDIISRTIYGYFGKIYRPFILNQIVLNMILGIIVFIIGKKFLEDNKNKEKNKCTVKFILLIVLVFNIYNISRYVLFRGELNIINNLRLFEGILSGIYFLSVILFLFIAIKDKVVKKKSIFLIFSSIAMVAPLLYVFPAGSRRFFPAYILLTALTTLLFKHIIDEKMISVKYSNYLKSVAILIFALFAILYSIIVKVEINRKNSIKDIKNIKVEKLCIPKLPFENYHWNGNPYDEVFVEKYKKFNEIDNNVKVIFVDYPEWKELRRKNAIHNNCPINSNNLPTSAINLEV